VFLLAHLTFIKLGCKLSSLLCCLNNSVGAELWTQKWVTNELLENNKENNILYKIKKIRNDFFALYSCEKTNLFDVLLCDKIKIKKFLADGTDHP